MVSSLRNSSVLYGATAPFYLPINHHIPQVSNGLQPPTSSKNSFSSLYLHTVKTMQSSQVTELNYLLNSNPSDFPAHFGLTTPTNEFHRFSNSMYPFYIPPQMQELNPKSTSFSSNSTSDEADDQQSIINERKQRRMISNRESARRSRMRKQKHLDELWSQVVWLQNENHQLIDKLNHVSENHDQVVKENAQLKEEALEIRQMISDMQLSSPYPGLRELEDEPCNELP